MFQREHTIFIIKSYYSNGNRGENGDWIYSPRLCLNFEVGTHKNYGQHLMATAIQRFLDHTIFLCINNLEHALFALTNTAAGSAAGFSIFYSSITAQL
jgi:hypothetical protein